MNNQKLIVVLGAAALLIGGFFVASSMYKGKQAEKLEEVVENSSTGDNAFVRPYSQRLGPKDAKVIVTEFLDPGCEACSAVYPHVKQILDQHPGKVQLVIRYIPLHKGADQAVKMLEAARLQGKYWEVLAEMESLKIDNILRQDMADAQTLGVRKTPTFFVNGKPLPSFGLQELQTLVASEVAAN
jgi:protein-disulfide isomerase